MEKQDLSAGKTIRLSDRMSSIAGMVTPGNRLADVGCDHGYIPIFLCQKRRIPGAIAMDINAGPLKRASLHIAECGFTDRILTRLSDGLEKLGENEADTILIAGMGGGLMCRILTGTDRVSGQTAEAASTGEDNSSERAAKTDSAAKCRVPTSVTELILQPQSDVDRVRRCIRSIGFVIVDEDMVEEDGKFYPIIKAARMRLPCESRKQSAAGTDSEEERKAGIAILTDSLQRVIPEEIADAFGAVLLKKRHPVLKRWLKKELLTADNIIHHLRKTVVAADRDIEQPDRTSVPEADMENVPEADRKQVPEMESAMRQQKNRGMARYREVLHKKEMITAALAYYDDAGDNWS